ncbi:MAG: carbohydrate ABC transporter permease [Propionibacteriaceae bacterium]|jgi:raffinose/stachyose/melibiose transport system permease protein|nr:carbohydrate ABC transporter permease [Propionibacteriaceae bacterium]
MNAPAPAARRSRPRAKKLALVRYAILTLIAIPWVVLPFWVLLVNSWKTDSEAGTPTAALPTRWALVDNLKTVIQQGRYFIGLKNSLIVAVPVVLGVLLLGSMAAWSYARTAKRSLLATYYLTALSIILPPAIVPTVVILTKAHLTGSVLGYILALVGTRIGVIVFLTTGYIRGLPLDFEDAAQIDGANRWQIYWHVILPLVRSVLFTAAVMTVINVWNDFLFALYMIKGMANSTLPLTLYNFANAGQYGLRWNLVFMHVVLTSLPLVIAYVVLQKRVMSGLTEGGVTG